MNPLPSLAHRPDIDGLRAIAILSAILFHFEFEFIRGGYAGVDLFFVISGYLITGTSLRRLETWVDIGDFFRRRVARLLPMVTLTCIATCVAAHFLFAPAEARLVYRSSGAVGLFFPNIFLLGRVDYFQEFAALSPFLHMWSLGVEEQFYLVIPFILFFVRRHVRVLAALCALSFVHFLTFPDGASAYYLLPSRMWELCLGALLVYAPAPRTKAIASGALMLALVSFLVGLYLMRPSFDDPVIYRIFPAGAAALVIWGGRLENVFSRSLGWKPLAAIGIVSFSAYLIHWPLWVYVASPTERVVSLELKLAILVGAFVLAGVCYRFIERPAQTGMRKWNAKRILTFMFASIVVTTVIPWSLAARITDPTRRFKMADESGTCFLDIDQRPPDYRWEQCVPAGAGEKWLLWGDSYAAHYLHGMKKAKPGVEVFQATTAECAPLNDSREYERCRWFSKFVLGEILPKADPDVIVIAARWDRIANLFGGNDELARALAKVLDDELIPVGKKIVIVGMSPLFHGDVRLVLRRREFSEKALEDVWLPAHAGKARALNSELRQVASSRGLDFFDPIETFCREQSCLAVKNGRPLFHDTGHMNHDGSDVAAQALLTSLSP